MSITEYKVIHQRKEGADISRRQIINKKNKKVRLLTLTCLSKSKPFSTKFLILASRTLQQ